MRFTGHGVIYRMRRDLCVQRGFKYSQSQERRWALGIVRVAGLENTHTPVHGIRRYSQAFKGSGVIFQDGASFTECGVILQDASHFTVFGDLQDAASFVW